MTARHAAARLDRCTDGVAMQIDDIIALLKARITPSFLDVIVEDQRKHTVFLSIGIINVQGTVSGNVRIVINHRTGEKEYFILSPGQFRSHPLKINQWK